MAVRPIIGVLLDYQAEGSFSKRPHYALRTVYFEAIWKAGGTPVAIPYLEDALDDYLELCHGFLFPGGFYPFPARLYGRDADPAELPHPRFQFEERLMRRVIAADAPVLGICAGMQVMAGLYGGTFFANLHDDIDSDIDHLNGQPAEQTAHGVEISQGSRLSEVLATAHLQVNTAHNEALRNRPDGLDINAVGDDGVVEGIEVPGKRFCLGVQWHPEFFAAPGNPNFNLFTALVRQANESN